MKNIILIFSAAILMCGIACCGSSDIGERRVIVNTDSIEVSKINLGNDGWIYVARYKSQPNIETSTWREDRYLHHETHSSIIIHEDDSTIIIKK